MLNIVICGTPGTGKSTLIDILKEDESVRQFNFINLSQYAKDNECITSHDDILESDVIDEDKLIEKLTQVLKEKKSNIIESIHGDILPSDLINHIFVCRTDNTILYDRLTARNYGQEKLKNNVEAEIFQTIYDEVMESFNESKVTLLINNQLDDLQVNSKIILNHISSEINQNCSS